MHRFLLDRRTLLTSICTLAADAALPGVARSASTSTAAPRVLTARPGSARLLEETDKRTPIWGYDGMSPGPLLRVKQGDELWVRLKNELPQPTTIHWHGIRIDNAMDGVARLTQDPVAPGETFDYRFTVPDAGTYWYHPHNRTWEQLARGLYGVLIVDEFESVPVDREIVIAADDWRVDENAAIHEASFGSVRDRAHAGRLGNILTLNGDPEGRFPVKSGELARVRLCNMCNARILELRFEQLRPTVIALDGQPVAPYPLKNEILTLAPAQRADLLIRMTGSPGSSSALTEVSRSRLVAGRFVYGPGTVAERKTDIRLPDNRLPEPDIAGARQVDLVMAGGAMGRMEEAVFKGRTQSLRELAREHGMVWAFNGTAGMTETPLFAAKRGESIALRMVNDTRWPHAMHIHGHHFKEAGPDEPWRDTLLLEPSETRTAYFVADNPGKWMLHCHMLEHQAGGMATWFQVNS